MPRDDVVLMGRRSRCPASGQVLRGGRADCLLLHDLMAHCPRRSQSFASRLTCLYGTGAPCLALALLRRDPEYRRLLYKKPRVYSSGIGLAVEA
mmetsp:Transcript_704/g.1881  ORF Transcript_704/g.1881 Transcript_704/m.1881 type:complete len:94 (+) Transcript_704:149-430(+)